MKIAIIGTGNLGESIAKGILDKELTSSLWLTKRHIENLEIYRTLNGVYVTSNNVEAIQNAETLIFALQPKHQEMVLKEVQPYLQSKHTIISTAAGFNTKKIESIIGKEHSIIIAMPNTAISVGKSMTCLSSNLLGKERVEIVRKIFNSLGHTMLIPESQMQAATVVCASGVAFWMRLIRATTQAAIQLGFDSNEAQELAIYTCEGSAKLLIENGLHPEQEIDHVTTPKGCTIEGLNEMEHSGLSSSLIKGMVASYHKISNIKDKEL
jgi:pyrroline-5-carboxylate reductase